MVDPPTGVERGGTLPLTTIASVDWDVADHDVKGVPAGSVKRVNTRRLSS